MKITQLDLTAFRSYTDTTLNMDAPRVLISGRNGSGKTSILDALKWAFLGHCAGTDARGAGAEVLIPTGEKAAEVAVQIAGIGRAVRSYGSAGGSFTVDAFTGTSAVQQQALQIKLDTTPAYLDAVLDTAAFLNLGHVEAKAMVLSLLGVKIPINAAEPQKSVQPGDLVGLYTLDELDAKYKQAFEDRKLAKRTLAGSVVPAKPEAAHMPAVSAVEEQLGKLRQALGELQKATGSVTGKRSALEAEGSRVAEAMHANPGEDRSAQVEDLKVKLAALESQVMPATLKAPAKGDPQRVIYLQEVADKLRPHLPKAGCVLDRTVPCKTPASAFEARLTALDKELKAIAPKQEKPSQEPAQSPLTALRHQIADLERKEQLRLSAVHAVHAAQTRWEAIQQELKLLPSTATQDAEITTLQGRIGKGEELLRTARAHWQAVSDYEKAVSDKAWKAMDVDRLETLCEQLGPNGVRVQALAEAMGKFEKAVNPYVAAFGWNISFAVEPWEVFANGRPVGTYSKSEQFRIGIAFQLGIAQLSGLNFCVVDEVDQLDAANRVAVTKMLLQAPLEQVIVLGTREETQPLPQNVPGLLSYRLKTEQGRTVIAESVQGVAA